MKSNIRNIYTALRFAERPDLHLTLRYYPKMAPNATNDLIGAIGLWVKENKPEGFVLQCNSQVLLGPRRNVKALHADNFKEYPWPHRIRDVSAEYLKDVYVFFPHVTTPEEGPLVLKVTSVAVMHKDTVLQEWML